MSEQAVEEQVIVTQGVGVVQPKPNESAPGVGPPKRANEAKKRVPPTPLPTETVIGAAIRVQLCEILGFGPLTADRVEWMCNIVEESLPLLQTTMGLKVKRPASPLPRGAVAGVKTVLGMIPLAEWCSAWGIGNGGRVRHAKTLAKIVFRRAKEKFSNAADAVIVTEEAKDLDTALRTKILALLSQPYTPPVAKRLERLLGAISPLYQALGPAADRVKRGKKVQPGNYGTYSPGSYASAVQPSGYYVPATGAYVPLGPITPVELAPGEDPNIALMNEQMMDDPAFSMASFQAALNGTPTPTEAFSAPAPNPSGFVSPTVAYGDGDENEDAPPLVGSPPIETFGAKIIREIMAMAPVLMNAQRNTPENMVLAIVAAEREGMPKLAAKLRKLMGVDKAGEQETPKPAFHGISAFVTPDLPHSPPAGWGGETTMCYDGCGNEAKKIGKDSRGFLHPYCEKDYATRLESGFLVEDCADPSCGVKGKKPGVNAEGLVSLYCGDHYIDALRLGDVVEGSDGNGHYRNGRCVDCNRFVGRGHGPGCSAVAP